MDEDKAAAVAETLHYNIEARELKVDNQFFAQPRSFGALADIQPLLAEWLQAWDLSAAEAEAISERLPTYFVFALNREWREHAEKYAPLKKSLDTPFTRAAERESRWLEYAAFLERQVDEPLFGVESFGLRQVFVSLRAAYTENRPSELQRGTTARREAESGMAKYASERSGKRERRIVVDALAALNEWAQAARRDDALRVVSGGPGYGKSSLARMFAAAQAQRENHHVVYVPLQRFKPQADLRAALRAFAEYDPQLPPDILETNDKDRYLFIFDGLDELEMQGKETFQAAADFVTEVKNSLGNYNQSEARILALICGREPVVQSNENKFGDPRRILHLLPYYLTKKDIKESNFEYLDSVRLLKIDQRAAWWSQYGRVRGTGETKLPKELKREELDELTALPLLNYLIALSRDSKATDKVEKIDFSAVTNRNVIYGHLFNSIYRRVWHEPYGKTALGNFTPDEFVRIMEETALVAWHGAGRTVTQGEISAHCERQPHGKNLLDKLRKDVDRGETRLLVSFYFRQQGKREASGDEAFEFTHKSFSEYLAARRIVRALQMMHDDWQSFSKGGNRGSQEECLADWLKLFGQMPLDEAKLRFLRDEIALYAKEEVVSWQNTLCRLIEHLVLYGMPAHRLEPRPSLLEEIRHARNAEETLLATLSASAYVTNVISLIHWENNRGFSDWIHRLRPHPGSDLPSLFANCLNHLNLLGANLVRANFVRANLESANLAEANLEDSMLAGANLKNAILENANLESSILIRANLEEAILEGAILVDANLEDAKLHRANLKDATLFLANLTDARLEDAILIRTYLAGANLFRTNLIRATLADAVFANTILGGAIFDDANLFRANLRTVDLSNCLGLNIQQIENAIIDETTKLPDIATELERRRTLASPNKPLSSDEI